MDVNKSKAQKLYRVLRRHLGQNARGKQLITAFENDPEQGSEALADYLRKQLPEDTALAEKISKALGAGEESQVITVVTGGTVDQIINIARIGALDLTLKKHFFIFRDVKQVSVFLFVILAVGASIAYFSWLSSQPHRMNGDYNIAVAQFGEVTAEGIEPSTEATEISNSLFHFLDSEYKATNFGLNTQITHKNIPIITEDLEAEGLAQRTNADIVIYGNVHTYEDTAEFFPRFYVSDNTNAGELTGSGELAYPIAFDIAALSFQDEINVKLRTRAAILVSFTKGLIYLAADDLDGALFSFQESINEAKRHDQFNGQEVLYLFTAIVKYIQEDWDEAHENLDEALALNPEYARAYIARGNVYYYHAIQDSFDEVKLEQALTEYQRALTAQDNPPSAYIEEKVVVALGNVYLVRAQLTDDQNLFAQAIAHYSQVTTKYEDTNNEKIRGLAAIAYYGLGVAYERQMDYSQAMDAFQHCIDVTGESELKSRAESQLARLMYQH